MTDFTFFLFLCLQFHSISFVALEFKVDIGFAFVYIIAQVCVRLLWLWPHSCSRCLASPLAQLVCPCKTTLGLRMKYETLAPYFTLAVAGLKDGSLDVCLPFPSTLSFSLTSACSHLHLLFFSPYFICSLPSPLSLVLAAKYTYVLSTLRERERYTPVGGLCCGYTVRSPRIQGSESGNTEDWFLHSTHHKNGFIWLFLCMCLMLVIFLYVLPLFSFFILTEFLRLFHAIFFCALFDPRFESPRHMSFVRRCSLAFRW